LNNQLLMLCLNCSLESVLRRFCVSSFQIVGPHTQKTETMKCDNCDALQFEAARRRAGQFFALIEMPIHQY